MQHKRFSAVLKKRLGKGAWTYVVWPESVKFFGTRGLVKIRGTIDGRPLRASFMATGNGKHMLPIKAETRAAIGKKAGQRVDIVITKRLK
jgi:hypothetical protein